MSPGQDHINGKAHAATIASGQYAEVKRSWKKGDQVQLLLDMPVTLIETNPLVEETRNQVAVKRGPVVYCLESAGLGKNNSVFGVGIPANARFNIIPTKIDNSNVTLLETTVKKLDNGNWKNELYKEVSKKPAEEIKIRLVPYYAWGNRGHAEMSVWLPVIK